jgi:zinc-RING finger domain
MNPVLVTGTLIYAAADAPHFDCPVCMEHICKSHVKVLTSCGHLFCENCILRTQKSKPHSDCIKCPMCRMQLEKLVPRPVPLERVPLHKIRSRAGCQRYRIDSIKREISAAPDRILFYTQLIEQIAQQAADGQATIDKETALLAELEAQIVKRQRTRRAPALAALAAVGAAFESVTPPGTPPATPRAEERRRIGDLI